MREIRLHVITDTGDKHVSEWMESSEQERQRFTSFLKEFPSMKHLDITLKNGRKMYFNPRHIVSVTIQER